MVQGDREVAVGGRGLRWSGVIVVSRAGGCGTGGGPGVLPGRSGRAGRGPVCGRGGWLVVFGAGALAGTVRVRMVLPGGSGGSGGWAVPGSGGAVTGRVLLAGRLCWRGGCLRCRVSGAGRGGRAGRCRARRAGRRGAGAVLRGRAVLRRVVEQGLLDGAGVAVDVAGVVQIGGRGRRRGLDRGPGGVDGLGRRCSAACLSSSSLGAVRPASGWTAAVSMRRKTALLASAAASSRSRRLLVMPGCIQAGISSHRMRAGARSSPLRSVISPSGQVPYQRSPELS